MKPIASRRHPRRPMGTLIQRYATGVFIAVLNIMGSYFRREMVRTKRSFEPKSLIGTMQPVNTSSGD